MCPEPCSSLGRWGEGEGYGDWVCPAKHSKRADGKAQTDRQASTRLFFAPLQLPPSPGPEWQRFVPILRDHGMGPGSAWILQLLLMAEGPWQEGPFFHCGPLLLKLSSYSPPGSGLPVGKSWSRQALGSGRGSRVES